MQLKLQVQQRDYLILVTSAGLALWCLYEMKSSLQEKIVFAQKHLNFSIVLLIITYVCNICAAYTEVIYFGFYTNYQSFSLVQCQKVWVLVFKEGLSAHVKCS